MGKQRLESLAAGFIFTRNPFYLRQAQAQMEYEQFAAAARSLGASQEEVDALELTSRRLAEASARPGHETIDQKRQQFLRWLASNRPE